MKLSTQHLAHSAQHLALSTLVAAAMMTAIPVHAQFLGQQSLSQSSYVIDKNGHLFAFGWNWAGQLGVGDKTDRNTPVEVPIPPGATRWTLVAAGTAHVVALADSDKLYAWGSNRYGQLGTGTLGEVVVPVRVANPPGVTAWKGVTAGRDHSLALTSTGQLYAWGNNVDGQLGTGNRLMATRPQPIQRANGVDAWAEVAAGPGYTLAINTDGQLLGWGVDSIGSCYSTAPWRASGHFYRSMTPLPALCASNKRESAIGADGHYMEGWSEAGDTTQFVTFADGGYHTLAIKIYGDLHAVGENHHGQLGFGDTIPHSPSIPEYIRWTPKGPETRVPFPVGVTQWVGVAAGLSHSLALGNDGWLYAWGDNAKGELGIGASPDKWSPVRVMKVGDSLVVAGRLSGPALVDSIPFSISLLVVNPSSSVTLTSATADLVPSAYVYLKDSSMHEPVSPSTMPPLANSTAVWQAVGTPYWDRLKTSDDYRYYAFVRANGSAPLIVNSTVSVHTRTAQEWITSWVVDSLTGKPIPNARIFGFDGTKLDTLYSAPNGSFRIFFSQMGTFGLTVSKENYQSKVAGFVVPSDGNIPLVELAPAPVVGTFNPASGFDSWMGITSFYYPDSLIGFAIGGNLIWRTIDSGAHWNACFSNVSSNTFRSIRFANPRLGIAVGDAGEIAETSDGGTTWIEENTITPQNLHAVAFSDRDIAWAVGDEGTVLKRSLDSSRKTVWTAVSIGDTAPLVAIHFLDARHGIMGANTYSNKRLYMYDGTAWSVGYGPVGNLHAVYYASPNHIFTAGAYGVITDLGVAFANFQQTFIWRTINSLYFLNEQIGYAAADNGASIVTYDGGYTWAPLEEIHVSASSLNFYGVNGGMLSEGNLLRFNGHATPISAIVKGHVVFNDSLTGIRGVRITRTFSVKGGITLDSVWTNELGNFVFAPIKDTFHYDYKLYYMVNGKSLTHYWPSVSAKPGQIVTLNFVDTTAPSAPPPPPPDTQHAAVTQTELAGKLAPTLSLDRAEGSTNGAGTLHAVCSLPGEEQATSEIFDVMGRSVQRIASGIYGAGSHDAAISTTSMVSGTYYVRMITSEGELIRGFAVIGN